MSSKTIFIKITSNNEEIKKLISSFVFPDIHFIERNDCISASIKDTNPRYVEILKKIPELLSLNTLVEVSNQMTIDTISEPFSNQYIELPSVDSFLSECSEQSKKRYFDQSDDLEEGEIAQPKKVKKDDKYDYYRNRYLDKRDYFINTYLSEVDYLIKNKTMRIGDKYDIYKIFRESKTNFNKNFYYFYSSSPKSRDYLSKLGINETPMDIIKSEIKNKYQNRFICISNVSSSGYVDSKIERIR